MDAFERNRQKLEANRRRLDALNIQLNKTPTPAPTAPKQSFFNKIRDQFDANTEADQYRRQQVGDARLYSDQQKNRGIGRIANNPWERTLNTGKSIVESVKTPYEALGRGLSTAFGEGNNLREFQAKTQQENNRNIENLQKQLKLPTTSLADRAKIRSKLNIASRSRDVQFGQQMDEFKRLEKEADPLKMAGNIAQIGTDLAGLGVAGFAGKEFGQNVARLGFKQAAKMALPAVGANAALNTIQGGVGELQSDNPTLAGAARKSAFGLAAGTASDLVLGGLPALFSNKAYKNVVKELAGESDGVVVRDTVRSLSKYLPEERLNVIAKEIADTTDETAVDDILKKAAQEELDIKSGRLPTTDTPNTKTTTTTPEPTISQEVITGFKNVKTPQEARDSVKALFPELDDNTVSRVAQDVANAKDDNTVKQVLEQAQAQRKAVTEGVQNVTPQAEALPPTTEQQIAQVAQEQPQAQLTSKQAPDADIQANQVTQRVDEAGTPVNAVQDAVDPLADGERYTTTNADISFGSDSSGGTVSYKPDGTGTQAKQVSYNQLSDKTRTELVTAENNYAKARANSKGPVEAGTRGEVQIAKEQLDIAQSNAIEELGLQDYANKVDSSGNVIQKTYNDRYIDWAEAKYKSLNPDEREIFAKDAKANPEKYKAQFEAESRSTNQVAPEAPTQTTRAVQDAVDEGKVFYHGTRSGEVKSLKDLQAGSKTKSSSRNRVYVTENPEIAKNFGDNVVSEKLYGKHLDVRDIGIEKTPGWAQDNIVSPEFADFKTTNLLSEREKRVFENQFVKGVPNNTIIEDTPGIHKYLESKGYTTVTVPRPISDVAGVKSETIIISDKAFTPPVTTVESKAGKIVNPEAPTQATRAVADANPAVVPDTQTLFGNAPQFVERGLSLPQQLSPDRLIRENITQPLEKGVNKLLFKAQTSKNPVVRGFGRLTQGISREAGVSPELLAQKRLLRGGVETGKVVRESVSALGDGLSKDAKTKVWSTLDPERAAELGVKVAKEADLTPEEVAYKSALTQVRDYTTQENLKRGLITPEQAANPDYLKRGYSVFEQESDNSKVYTQTREALLKQFKGRKDVNEKLIEEAITDPGYLVAKKSAESHAAWAMVDYSKYLTDSGLVSDVEKAGYRQLPTSKLFGEASGKFVPVNIAEDFTGFQYNNGMMSAFNDLITAYDSLGIRKAKKELLTVFNPAVRGGNQASNRLIFSNMNGINPIQFNKAYIDVGKDIANKSQLYREAVAQGLTGIDITQADFAAKISDYVDDPNIAKKAIEWTKKSYSAADDKARVAAFKVWRERGYSASDAAALVQRGFQDYKSVGFFYDLAAKTPLVGNAFVRFAGDSIRIAKNAALDHPLRTAATVALWANMVNIMSKVSGETPEDKATREGRFGAPTLPGTDISLTVQTPWGEVNAARFLPFYQLNDVQSTFGRFLPIQGNPLKPEGWQDPLLGQFGQLATDTDFRGKSIADPNNTVDDQGNKRYVDELSNEKRNKNRARFFGVQNIPLGREIDQIGSAIKGVPDQYGKLRSVPQAVLRSGGIKVEQYGAKQAQDQRDTNSFFTERDRINAEVKGLPKADQEAYKRLTGYYKLREQTDNTFKPGTKRDLKAPVYEFSEDKWKDYTSHPGLYELQVQEKVKASQPNPDGSPGVPLQPEFNPLLSEGFRKQLINNKSQAPGEDIEADERMYSNPEWDKYNALKEEYKAKAAKYYPQKNGEFTDELVKHQQAKFPVKGAAKKAYDDAYQSYIKGNGPKPVFTDAVKAEKEAYSEAKRNWTNEERKARGLPAIDKKTWDNKTFGFTSEDSSSSGYSKFGYSRKGGSSKKEKTQKTYIGTLLGDVPNISSNEIAIRTTPKRAKFKVKTPGGKGRNYKKIKLG